MNKKGFTPLETIGRQRRDLMSLTGFTLIEVLISFSVFVIVTGLVLAAVFGGFRSFSQGQKMAQKEQRGRFVFFRLGKELSSLTRIVYPGSYFKGDDKSFFLSTARKTAWQNRAILTMRKIKP